MGRIRQGVIALRDRGPKVIRLPEREGDSEAAYDLAVTTHRFSKRAQEMVDDKLSLSAALMRAGEVDEARRMLAEAEQDLRCEEAELMRQVDELGSYRAMHRPRVIVIERDRVSRSSLMRTVAVAAASSAVIALATIGGAVIGLFEQRPDIDRVRVTPAIDGADVSRARSFSAAGATDGITVRINGIRVVLTRAEWRALKRAQRAGDEAALSHLLDVIAPELAASTGNIEEIIEAIGEGAGEVVDGAKGSDGAQASGEAGDPAEEQETDGGTTSEDGTSTDGSGADGTSGDGSSTDGGGSKGSNGGTTDGDPEGGGAGDGTPTTGDILPDATGGTGAHTESPDDDTVLG